jgi:hypothetical protein
MNRATESFQIHATPTSILGAHLGRKNRNDWVKSSPALGTKKVVNRNSGARPEANPGADPDPPPGHTGHPPPWANRAGPRATLAKNTVKLFSVFDISASP